MWQRIQITLILVLTLALGASIIFGFVISRNQQRLADAFRVQAEAIRAEGEARANAAQAAAMEAEARALEQEQGATARLAAQSPGTLVQPGAALSIVAPNAGTGVVYVTGRVSRPGTYAIPQVGTLTAWRVLIAAGGTSLAEKFQIVVTRNSAEGKLEQRTTGIRHTDGGEPDIELRADDIVTVE